MYISSSNAEVFSCYKMVACNCCFELGESLELKQFFA